MREPFSAFIEAISEEFASLRLLVERAAAQVSDEQFFANLDNEANSVGTLIRQLLIHLQAAGIVGVSLDIEVKFRMSSENA